MVKLLSKLLILLSFSISCKNTQARKIKLNSNIEDISISYKDSVHKQIKANNYEIEYDVFEKDLMSIRESKLTLNTQSFVSIWKEPDSILTYTADCGYLEGKIIEKYFFDGIIFENYDDESNLNEIDFTLSNETIVHPKLKLNKETSIDQFIKLFPNSYRERSEKKVNDVIYSTLRFAVKKGWDEYIHLHFKNKKLNTFLIWNPC